MPRRSRPVRDRFYDSFCPEPMTGCWLWSRTVLKGGKGYGQIEPDGRHHGSDRKGRMAHRVSWQLHHGEIPESMKVLHKCDTPTCVNPSHLFLGTNAENSHDMVRKGRSFKGSRCPSAKLTEAIVREIRSRLARGESPTVIAGTYGVDSSTVHDIEAGRTWGWL